MSLPVIFRTEAQDDLLAARNWYDEQSPGRGDLFSDQIELAVARIEENPEMYAATYRGVRPCKIRSYPYVIYYRILADQIDVIAVMHGSRNPQVWKGRV